MTETQAARTNKQLKTGIIVILLAVLFVIILRRAWISDDAYITFRTVDNFLHGYGLTWNTGERVQAYTHPLWMFLVSFFSLFTREIYFTITGLSLLLSMAAAALIPTRLSKSLFGSALAITVLLFSNAFVDYTTSGLENPLSYLLGGIFLVRYFQYQDRYTDLLVLSGIASLAALNRLDSLVTFIPALAYVFLQTKNRFRALLYMALGQLPLVAWEIFSIIYYGFPFPNTYYAKLSHMLPANELLVQGLRYCQESLINDPLTLIVILSGVIVSVWMTATRKGWQNLAVAAGVVIYMAAIVRTGGDFMSGRFFAMPLYMLVILLSRINFSGLRTGLQVGIIILPVVLGMLAKPPTYDVTVYEKTYYYGVTNERNWYFETNSLINQSREKPSPFHDWVEDGKEFRNQALASSEKFVTYAGAVGMTGYFAGPDVHIIDRYGLGDALIARLPAVYDPEWRIGHHWRVGPDGYAESLRIGKDLLIDRQLALFYERLALIIRGKLFTIERFKTILAMNLGRYQPLIDTDHYKFPYKVRVSLFDLPKVEQGGEHDVNLNPNGGQIVIFLEYVSHAGEVEVGLDAGDKCQVWFASNKYILHRANAGLSDRIGMQPQIIPVPQPVTDQGYDFIWLVPDEEDATCVPGWIKLLE